MLQAIYFRLSPRWTEANHRRARPSFASHYSPCPLAPTALLRNQLCSTPSYPLSEFSEQPSRQLRPIRALRYRFEAGHLRLPQASMVQSMFRIVVPYMRPECPVFSSFHRPTAGHTCKLPMRKCQRLNRITATPSSASSRNSCLRRSCADCLARIIEREFVFGTAAFIGTQRPRTT